MLEKKLRLLESLVKQSSLAKRIEASSQAQAKAVLASAREDCEQARSALAQDDLKAADDALARGLQGMTSASRLTVAAPQQDEQRAL